MLDIRLYGESDREEGRKCWISEDRTNFAAISDWPKKVSTALMGVTAVGIDRSSVLIGSRVVFDLKDGEGVYSSVES